MELMLASFVVNHELLKLQTIQAILEDGIFTITLNRPDKLNALNHQTLEDLRILIEETYINNDIKAVIITGSGNKAFVAGADISELAACDSKTGYDLARFGCDIFDKIEACPKPIIAAVNGFALGGGCELAMACHLRVATTNAKFGQPEVNLGIIPGYGGTQRLTELIGKSKSLELLMTADMLDAQEAYRLGLANYVVEQEQLMQKSKELLLKIMSKSPVAIKGVIDSVNAFYAPGVDGFKFETDTFSQCLDRPDFAEGTNAFLEKRKANFTGK